MPDGVFVDGDEGRFEMLPVPTNANVLAILDRIMRQITRRLAKDAANVELEEAAPDDRIALWGSITGCRATSAASE